MTLSNASNKAGPYLTNGVTTQFSFPYKVLQAADLQVYRTDVLTGQEVLLTTEYSVALINNGTDGATITISPAIATGYKITILRVVDYLQNDYDPSSSSTYYADVLEGAMDKRVMQIQQLKEQVDRAVKIPITSEGVSTDLPAPRAGYVIGSTDGESYENLELVDAGQAIAGNWTVDRFLAGGGFIAGVSTSVPLSKTPASAESVLVFFDGVAQHRATYSVSGTTLNFTSAIPLGVAAVEVRIPTTLAVGDVPDGSILDSCVVTPTGSSFGRTLADHLATLPDAKITATGSTTGRLLADRAADFIYPEDFGAVGDGVADDTAAVQAAIDTYRCVRLRAGKTYLITSPLNITDRAGGGVSIIGERFGQVSSAATFKANTNGILFDCAGSQYLLFENFAVSATGANRSKVAFNFMRTTTSQYAQFNTLRNIWVSMATEPTANGNKGNIALANTAAELMVAENCYFAADNPLVLTGYNDFSLASAFKTYDGSIPSMSVCTFKQVTFVSVGGAYGTAIYVVNSHNIRFESCYWAKSGPTQVRAFCLGGNTHLYAQGSVENYVGIAWLKDSQSNAHFDLSVFCNSSSYGTFYVDGGSGAYGFYGSRLNIQYSAGSTLPTWVFQSTAGATINNTELTTAAIANMAQGSITVANVKANFGGTITNHRSVKAVGDLEASGSSYGVVLTSPNGQRWRVNVNNSGVLGTTGPI